MSKVSNTALALALLLLPPLLLLSPEAINLLLVGLLFNTKKVNITCLLMTSLNARSSDVQYWSLIMGGFSAASNQVLKISESEVLHTTVCCKLGQTLCLLLQKF